MKTINKEFVDLWLKEAEGMIYGGEAVSDLTHREALAVIAHQDSRLRNQEQELRRLRRTDRERTLRTIEAGDAMVGVTPKSIAMRQKLREELGWRPLTLPTYVSGELREIWREAQDILNNEKGEC
ncbi:MAG: hypothetical protein AAF357_00320 [Verrucomicrobiota bacterium]